MMAKLQPTRRSRELPLVIKADVQGSAEAIVGSLDKLGTDEVRARIILSGAGAISESDVHAGQGRRRRRSSASTSAPRSRPATWPSAKASRSATTRSSTT